MKRIFFILSLLSATGFAEGFRDSHGVVHGLGLKRDAAKLRAFKASAHKFELGRAEVAVPGKFDLSPRVSLPENQGSCGSCWDLSSTKALRSALMLAGKDPGRLAFNYLLNNCGPGTREYGCSGGDFDAMDNMLGGAGPWLESQDPYTESQGRCKTGLTVAGTALKKVVVGPGNRPPTFQELATALSQNHELVVDVAVCGAWGNYSGGILSKNDCGAGSINHMINMNGYDCETSVDAQGKCKFDSSGKPVNGDGYLIAMNNWGEDTWGEVNPSNGHGGYMRTRAHVDAIADTAMYFEVEQPQPLAVDGGWSDWSACTASVESRTCTNPAPANGGKDCIGPSEQPCVVPQPEGGFPSWLLFVLGGLGIGVVVFFVARATKE